MRVDFRDIDRERVEVLRLLLDVIHRLVVSARLLPHSVDPHNDGINLLRHNVRDGAKRGRTQRLQTQVESRRRDHGGGDARRRLIRQLDVVHAQRVQLTHELPEIFAIPRRPHPHIDFIVSRRSIARHRQEGLQKVRRRDDAQLPLEFDEHRQLHLLNDIRRVHVRRPRSKLCHRRHSFFNLLVLDRNLQATQRDEM